jgi:hypothetical protein
MCYSALVREYLTGPGLLRDAVAGMTRDNLCAKPIPGRWSTLEVICHLADEDAIFSERIKRVVAESEPTLMQANPDEWVPRVGCHRRNPEQELRLIELIRCQTAHILRGLTTADFQRRGIHSADGPVTLLMLLQQVTEHIPHHVKFIAEKRAALRRLACAERIRSPVLYIR